MALDNRVLPPALVEKFGREALEAGQAAIENRRAEARYSGYLRSASKVPHKSDILTPTIKQFCPQRQNSIYADLEFDTLPLRPGSKEAFSQNWQSRDPREMWESAPAEANIGIRMGGNSEIAVIDCDSPKSYSNAQGLLHGLGYEMEDYPIVRTASETGRHFYVRFSDQLPGAFKKLTIEFGAGEFRYGSGAYVVAPPSRVNGNRYDLRHGDFRQLPRIALADIREIFGKLDASTHDIQLAYKENASIPRLAKALLGGAYPEYYSDRYTSRSEVEQAIISSLVNVGFSFDKVLALFLKRPAGGKFQQLLYEKGYQSAVVYLQRCYKKAITFTSHTSPGRKRALECLAWAQSRAWSGRTGSYDRSVYIAHAIIAQKAGKIAYAASSRTLAELAGCSWVTASKATIRLRSEGLIRLEKDAVIRKAWSNIYSLVPQKMQTLYTSSKRCEEVYKECTFHDAFRAYPGLGKTAGELWKALKTDKFSAKGLAEMTGRNITTVRRNLRKMSTIIDQDTGEIISMVEEKGKLWSVLPVDLDHIAKCRGVFGRGDRQRRKHQLERKEFREFREGFTGDNPASYLTKNDTKWNRKKNYQPTK